MGLSARGAQRFYLRHQEDRVHRADGHTPVRSSLVVVVALARNRAVTMVLACINVLQAGHRQHRLSVGSPSGSPCRSSGGGSLLIRSGCCGYAGQHEGADQLRDGLNGSRIPINSMPGRSRAVKRRAAHTWKHIVLRRRYRLAIQSTSAQVTCVSGTMDIASGHAMDWR